MCVCVCACDNQFAIELMENAYTDSRTSHHIRVGICVGLALRESICWNNRIVNRNVTTVKSVLHIHKHAHLIRYYLRGTHRTQWWSNRKRVQSRRRKISLSVDLPRESDRQMYVIDVDIFRSLLSLSRCECHKNRFDNFINSFFWRCSRNENCERKE